MRKLYWAKDATGEFLFFDVPPEWIGFWNARTGRAVELPRGTLIGFAVGDVAEGIIPAPPCRC